MEKMKRVQLLLPETLWLKLLQVASTAGHNRAAFVRMVLHRACGESPPVEVGVAGRVAARYQTMPAPMAARAKRWVRKSTAPFILTGDEIDEALNDGDASWDPDRAFASWVYQGCDDKAARERVECVIEGNSDFDGWTPPSVQSEWIEARRKRLAELVSSGMSQEARHD